MNVRWRKPSIGRYKCNVDASFPNNSNKVGFGMCIRDSDGNHVRSKTMFRPWVYTTQFADYFNKGRGDATEFGSIMDNNIYFSNTYLTNSHVEFIRRQTNEVAHTLARAATSSTSFQVFDDTPACITDLIFNEMI
ncbi:hypothetical protein MTR_3g010950 [Medicago truncatula]|uniref:RNase H type-1 domain-containing protein n=1 Tax=Medicago truncatula TaxID=3880 RepID=G7IVP8_MEDTR|nr:hypothetical protein MTR_3g010950 [Medicago truncatula]